MHLRSLSSSQGKMFPFMSHGSRNFSDESSEAAAAKNSSEAIKTAFNTIVNSNQSLNQAIQKLINKKHYQTVVEPTILESKASTSNMNGVKLESLDSHQEKTSNRGHGTVPIESEIQKSLNVFDYCCRFFENVSDFADSIPYFNTIQVDDQARLVENAWLELLVTFLSESKISMINCNASDRSSVYKETHVKIEIESDDLSNSDDDGDDSSEFNKMNSNGNGEFSETNYFQKFKSQVERLRLLDLTKEEYSYLKGVILYENGKFFDFGQYFWGI